MQSVIGEISPESSPLFSIENREWFIDFLKPSNAYLIIILKNLCENRQKMGPVKGHDWIIASLVLKIEINLRSSKLRSSASLPSFWIEVKLLFRVIPNLPDNDF